MTIIMSVGVYLRRCLCLAEQVGSAHSGHPLIGDYEDTCSRLRISSASGAAAGRQHTVIFRKSLSTILRSLVHHRRQNRMLHVSFIPS